VQKKALPRPAEVSFPAQHWTSLVPGQVVRVRDYDDQNFVAVIEMKSGNSHAVWIIRDDTRTRHVVGNTEGIELLPIDQTANPHPTTEVQDRAGRNQCS
jgi:hypothetical protein